MTAKKPTAAAARARRKPAAAKKAPDEAASKNAAGGKRAARPAGGPRIRVRMYRQGLGDCFLVSLLRPKGPPFHLMIDCGVILGTPKAADRLRAVVADIVETTEGRVDVLAVTHEHYDHVAGFVLAKDLFAAPGEEEAEGKLSVGELWFAWTEDPKDADAQRLRDARKARVEALAGLASRLNGMGADEDQAPEVLNALRFFGVGADGQGLFGADGKSLGATAQAMVNAAAFAGPGRIVYRRPGELWESPDAPGLRIYVLGPPDDDKSLKKTDSSTEVYHIGAQSLEAAVLLAAGGGGDSGAWDPYAPFDPAWSHALSDIAAGKGRSLAAGFLADWYFGLAKPSPQTDLSWRRIDGDWLGDAELLALALDGATNNTSLALAIELTDSGKVLLFPADAQVGNWLSWHGLDWGEGEKKVTAADLLARTAFYKVGHHGSHNATLKEKGLEQMPEKGLVAFIPVDHAMAAKKGWGRMPLPALVEELGKRCGDHLIRIDEDLPAGLQDVSAGPEAPEIGALYYDWFLPL